MNASASVVYSYNTVDTVDFFREHVAPDAFAKDVVSLYPSLAAGHRIDIVTDLSAYLREVLPGVDKCRPPLHQGGAVHASCPHQAALDRVGAEVADLIEHLRAGIQGLYTLAFRFVLQLAPGPEWEEVAVRVCRAVGALESALPGGSHLSVVVLNGWNGRERVQRIDFADGTAACAGAGPAYRSAHRPLEDTLLPVVIAPLANGLNVHDMGCVIIDVSANDWATVFPLLLAVLALADTGAIASLEHLGRFFVCLGPGIVVCAGRLAAAVRASVLQKCKRQKHAAAMLPVAGALVAAQHQAMEAFSRIQGQPLDAAQCTALWDTLTGTQAFAIAAEGALPQPPLFVQQPVAVGEGRPATVWTRIQELTKTYAMHWDACLRPAAAATDVGEELDPASRYALQGLLASSASASSKPGAPSAPSASRRPPYVEFENMAVEVFWAAHRAALSWRYPALDWQSRTALPPNSPNTNKTLRTQQLRLLEHRSQQILRDSLFARLSTSGSHADGDAQ